MKRYSEYKDSGVKWIGEIPEHWKAVSLKRVVKLINEKSNEQNIPYIALENIESFTGKILPLNEIEPDSICNKFKKDDVLFCKLRPYLTKCVSPSFDGKCTSELLVLRNFNGVANYLKYILLSPKLVMDINASTYGAKMPRANWNYIGLCHVPLPPLPEQEAIVTYLDTKVAKIDEYISIAEKKIAALEELKQTIIAEAVTRGIHKDVPMKDSGVKWIGMIPEHWKVMRLKKVAKIYSGNGFKISLQGCSEGDYPFYKAGELNKSGIYINKSANYVSNRIVKEENLTTIPSHSILFPKIGEAMKKNGRKINQSSCCIDNNCGALSILCHKEMNNVFFYYITKCIDMAYYDNGGTIPCLNTQKLLSEFVAIPYLEEQQEIVTYLDSKVANINQLCQAERSQIEKLKEYKQRLISDVVTGKVKVTND